MRFFLSRNVPDMATRDNAARFFAVGHGRFGGVPLSGRALFPQANRPSFRRAVPSRRARRVPISAARKCSRESTAEIGHRGTAAPPARRGAAAIAAPQAPAR